MSRFSFSNLPLQGLRLIERQHLVDDRGFFSRLFCAQELSAAGWHLPIAQINHSFTSRRGTVRGMHYQSYPNVEMKLVTCIEGEVLDVAIDLRKRSPTFLNWHAELLSKDNAKAILIPEGFAHGFQALTDNVNLLYCHSSPYNSEAELALNVNDPRLAINWPIEVTEISSRDASHPFIDQNFEGVNL